MKKLCMLILILTLSLAFADPERWTDPGLNSAGQTSGTSSPD
jgi:hypothetical protein